jgi:type II secretory pathway component GspD/PulD (secretin)
MKKLLVFIIIFSLLSASAFSAKEDLEVRVFDIQHGSARSMYAVFEHLKSPEGKVTLHDATNKLIVVDYPHKIKQMESVIKKLDVPKKQLEVTVIIAEVSGRFLGEIGISSGKIIIPEEKFKEVRYLLTSSEDSSIRSDMSIKILSGQPATLQVAQEEFFGGTIQRSGDATVYTPPTTRSAGNFLVVLPRVNDDGTIAVKIRPEMSRFQEDHSIYEQSILTQVVVHNGDTIAIGGVTTSRQRIEGRTLSRADLPAIEEGSEEYSKLMMFLTVKVLD